MVVSSCIILRTAGGRRSLPRRAAAAVLPDLPLVNDDDDFDEPDDLAPQAGEEREGLDDPAVPEPEIPPTHFE